MEKVTAAAVQATPVFLDREATVDKACRLIGGGRGRRGRAGVPGDVRAHVPGLGVAVDAVGDGRGVVRAPARPGGGGALAGKEGRMYVIGVAPLLCGSDVPADHTAAARPRPDHGGANHAP